MQILNLKDEPRHLRQLANWHHDEWSSLNPGRTIDQRIAYMQAYLSDDFVPSTFIAKGNDLMGSAAITENDMDTHPELTPWLASVFVAPTYRSQGFGSVLVAHAMYEAKQAGIGMLYLFTPDRVPFYERLGWRCLQQEVYREHWVTLMSANLLEMNFANCFSVTPVEPDLALR